MDINELKEIAKGFGIELDDCEQLWRIESACKFYVIRDKNTGKGNLIGVSTQDEICFKNLCDMHTKNGILCVGYNLNQEKAKVGEILKEYAAIDTATGKIITTGKEYYTGNLYVEADMKYFLFGGDGFVQSYLAFTAATFELAPKFIKDAKKIIKCMLKNDVKDWYKSKLRYDPFTKKDEIFSFSSQEQCKTYIQAVVKELQGKTHNSSSKIDIEKLIDDTL